VEAFLFTLLQRVLEFLLALIVELLAVIVELLEWVSLKYLA